MSFKSEIRTAGLLQELGKEYRVSITHEARCQLFKGEPCNCKPAIVVMGKEGASDAESV